MIGMDPDVGAALAEAGLRARGWRDVTTIRFPAYSRAAYRIDIEDGGTIKARCFEDAPAARRAFETRRALPDAFVPAFHCHGRVVLERWVHGKLVGTSPPDAARLVEAAGILAALHGTRVQELMARAGDNTGEWRARAEAGLRALAGQAALTEDAHQTLQADLARHDPVRMVVGVGHFDFCGENMVVDADGRLHVFDNERVSAGPLGFDLARTWYRWALSADAWRTFLHAYGAAPGSGGRAIEELRFWTVVVLVHSACLRLQTDAARLAVPLGRLRELAADLGGGPD